MKVSVLFLAGMVLGLVGCSSVRVSRDYDTAYDFSTLKTFAWKHAEQPSTGNPRLDNDLIDERVRAAAEAELAARGFRRAEGAEADFLLAYFIDFKQRISGSTVSFGVGASNYGRYGGVGYNTSVEDYEEGYLTIDVIDPAADKNIWRGVGRRTSYETTDPAKITKKVNATVAAILKNFPPKSKR